eukprot:CAMPEP_0201741172 /NCGR_PEP_ID=MMETSP0593-20130828/46676_1 /ASSEMBLY_ACC=CAM_ASM_000672 /TAXON_ID=267983 /ORGANISM="Skeletonema japonicum, Strain CCMP2506" /LENGTH=998 /DNA_ID=CAMNT_0048235501 /DNA_START=193 /DNA_END=3189 /DNA_ORIENTATION=+
MSDFIPPQQYDDDDASLISEDSKEPYFDIQTGRIVPAREAWAVLAAEGHPKYKHLATVSSHGGEIDNDTKTPAAADSVFRTAASNDEDDRNDIPIVLSCSSGGGPTQLSINRALHPELNDSKQGKISPSNHGPKKDTHHQPPTDDEDEETDPVIIRAKAMALAAQNGKKLTPEQLQLIAQPDVQQQKLIEEAKRMANSRHGQNNTHHGGAIINLQQGAQDLQQLGKDIKNFIKTEQGKPPSQWTADLGKFFEDQSLKKSTNTDPGDEVSATSATTDCEAKGAESPKRKKMEGFGSDQSAQPQQPQSSPTLGQRLSSLRGEENAAASGKWPSMPPLPILNKIIGAEEDDSSEQQQEAARISGVLWKRRSGFGKHSVNAWEKRRVELRGTKLVYYSTLEEEKEEEKNATGEGSEDGGATPRESEEQDGNSTPREAITSLKKGIEQAALAAEQQIQTAKDGFSRFAAGIDILKSPSGDTPRGILDLAKERAAVSASMGHSGAPTPFCLSIKVKSMTQWKFAFDSHGMMMEWLAALTDVIVETSLSAAEKPKEGNWELENYCIKRKDSQESSITDNDTGTVTREGTARASGTALSSRSVISDDDSCATGDNWMLAGNNLYIAWAAANGALLLARSSSTSIDQFWKLFVFTNFGIWQLCTRPKVSRRQITSVDITTEQEIPDALSSIDKSVKPIAGSTTIKVSSIVQNNELDMPSWLPISSSTIDVRSHGYLTTKKKIPCPGELYECIAVDCFSSNTRFPDIANRVKLPDVTFDDNDLPKTWRSPDIFIASLAIPTEAPRIGQSTDDGPGVTFVGYFKMKEETRAILRRVTAPGYNSSVDESESDIDVQKRIVNGVRLWEEYCIRAPSDPTFQARFKLIPFANLEELGIPAYISKYNGKPVLIKRNQVTGFFTDYPSLNAMSFEISFHPFPYLFKQAMSYLKDYFDDAIGTFGFVIEGRNDDELPEVMIGVMKGCYAGPSLICRGEDFFSGNCSKSSAAKKMD